MEVLLYAYQILLLCVKSDFACKFLFTSRVIVLTCTNCESSPTSRIMPKNMAAHRGDRGMEAIALG